MTKFTFVDVLDYYAGTLDEVRAEELLLARDNDPQVAGMFLGFQHELSSVAEGIPEEFLLDAFEEEGELAVAGPETAVAVNPAMPMFPVLAVFSVPLLVGSLASGDDDTAEPEFYFGVFPDGSFGLKCPWEDNLEVTYPYGMALVRYRERNGRLLAQRLMLVESNPHSKQFVGKLDLEAWLGGHFDVSRCESADFELVEVTDYSMSLIAPHHVKQVAKEAQASASQFDQELMQKLDLLKCKLGVEC